MTIRKTMQLCIGIIVYVAIIYVLDALINTFTLGLLRDIRNALPLKGFTAIICMHLITVLSLSILALIGGLFYWVSLKLIRVGAITYVVFDLMMSAKHHTFASVALTKPFPFAALSITFIFHAVVLVLALASSRSLYLAGRKIRENVTKAECEKK